MQADAPHVVGVGAQAALQATGSQVPQADGVVVRAGCDADAVVQEADRADGPGGNSE